MVSLDDVLEEKVEQRTQTLISWHRNTQLKQYAEILNLVFNVLNNKNTLTSLFEQDESGNYVNRTQFFQNPHTKMEGPFARFPLI